MSEVTKVRMEVSMAGGRHEHIEGVCTPTGAHFTRGQVVQGIRNKEDWHTKGPDGSTARIKETASCPRAG